jgi:hypothetical protein
MVSKIVIMSLGNSGIERHSTQIPHAEGLFKRDNEHTAEWNARAKEVCE